MTESNEPASVWGQVKSILERAHVGSVADYQGFGRFWLLPLDQFKEVVLYGVRMIAPPARTPPGGAMPSAPPLTAGGSCCGGGGTAGGGTAGGGTAGGGTAGGGTAGTPARAAAPTPGRGAQSGLILALRGQYPYDGSIFPPMPWGGGTRVPEADVQTIEAWIDAGCPSHGGKTNGSRGGAAAAERKQGLANGTVAHPASTRGVNDVRHDQGGAKFRKDIDSLTAQELQRYRTGIAWMKSLDNFPRDSRSFTAWGRIHGDNCQHGWEEFVTWHRMYLYFFEQTLQDYDPGITIPYWDWTTLYAVNRQVSAADQGEIPKAFHCFVDDSVVSTVRAAYAYAADKLAALNTPGTSFASGSRLLKAAGIPETDPARETIYGALEAANPLWHRYRWPGGGDAAPNQPLLFEEYPSPDDVERILELDNFYSFGSGPVDHPAFGSLENLHNLIHNFSGGQNPWPVGDDPTTGDMVTPGITAFDPIFWSHHANVDRLWAEWQRRHPGVTPDDPQDILAPWPTTVGETYSTVALGYEYALDAHVVETDPNAAITTLRSAPLGVKARVVARHRRAEVRLHKVQHRMEGGALRVFLNQPDADATTPMRGNDHFVGQIHLFAGDCIGGPGHCAVPPTRRRHFDIRPRHRKTPHNVRLDATATIQKLAAKGETDFHVNVVAVGIGGRPSAEVLRLDGVSLVFFG